MKNIRAAGLAALSIFAGACASAPIVTPMNQFGLPAKLAPTPTAAAISEADLKTRLYIFADDSMQGRAYGREGNMKGTTYIANELKRLGVEPAGDNGTYFQEMPVVQRRFARTSALATGGRALKWVDEWIAMPGVAAPRPFDGAKVIYGGTVGDTTTQITAAQANGKVVILMPAAPGAGGRGGPPGGGGAGGRGGAPVNRFAGAVAIATADLDAMNMGSRAFINDSPQGRINAPPGALAPPDTTAGGRGGRGGAAGGSAGAPAGPPQAQIRITRAAASVLLGAHGD